MGWVRDNLHWLLFVAFVLSTAATVGVGTVAALSFLAALFAPQGPIVAAVVEAIVPYVVPLLLLGALDVVLLVAAVGTAVRRISWRKLWRGLWDRLTPSVRIRTERRALLAAEAERRYPILRRLGLSDRLEPPVERRRENLKDRYVDGEISVEEFERRMAGLVDDREEIPAPPEVDRGRDGTGRRDADPGSGTDRSGREAEPDREDARGADPERDEDRDAEKGGTSIEIE